MRSASTGAALVCLAALIWHAPSAIAQVAEDPEPPATDPKPPADEPPTSEPAPPGDGDQAPGESGPSSDDAAPPNAGGQDPDNVIRPDFGAREPSPNQTAPTSDDGIQAPGVVKRPDTLRPSPGPLADPTERDIPPLGESALHEHDGLFFRLNSGMGFLSATRKRESYGAVCLGLRLTLGYTASNNALYFVAVRGLFAAPAQPDREFASDPIEPAVDTMTSGGFGAGIGYNLSQHLYATVALLSARVSFIDDEQELLRRTDLGIGIDAALGAEGWVSPRWSVGGVFHFAATASPDPVVEGWWVAVEATLGLSATVD